MDKEKIDHERILEINPQKLKSFLRENTIAVHNQTKKSYQYA